MKRPDLQLLALLTALALPLGCSNEASDDDVGSDTSSATDSSGSDSSGSETGSTDASSSATDSSATDSTATDSSATDSTATDATDSTDTGEPIMCPDVFPMFDKSCIEDSDCAVVIHTSDCCGNTVAWGLNAGEVEAFDAAEAICDAQYPQCDCPAGPTVAEDGNEALDPDLIGVSCSMGACTSFVPMP